MNLKEKITKAFGSVGKAILWLVFTALVFVPLSPLGFPVWANTLIALFIFTFKALGGLAYLVIWVWSFILVVQMPANAFTVVYFVVLAVCILLYTGPMLIYLISKRKSTD